MRVAQLGNVETREGLRSFRCCSRSDELRARADDDPIRLRIAAIARIAGGVKEICSIDVVKDGGTAVVSAVGVGLGDRELSRGIDERYATVVVGADWVRGIDDAGSV